MVRGNNLSTRVRRGNSGLSNKRGRELTITETLIHGPRVLILSSDSSTLSFTARTTVHATVTVLSCGPAIFVMDRHTSSIVTTSGVVILSSNGYMNYKARGRLLTSYSICGRVCTSRFKRRTIM